MDGPADSPGEPGDAPVGVTEDLIRTRERHREEVLRPGVPLDEHVVGDHAHPHLGAPHAGPDVRLVVDGPDQRCLRADQGTGAADPADCLRHDWRLQLTRVGEVRHEGERPAGGHDLLEQPEGVVGVGIGDEPLRPVGERLAADPDRLHVLHARAEQRLDVAAQHPGTHDHRIPAGDQHRRHLSVPPEVAGDPVDVRGGHLQVGLIHELRPAETVRAVRMAGLALLGKHQHGLVVLVLHARQRFLAEIRHVQGELPGGMRVQPHPDLVDGPSQLCLGRPVGEQAGDAVHVRRGQHGCLREDQAEYRVVGRRVPVDEAVHHVGVGTEREHHPDGLDGHPLGSAEPGTLHQGIEVLRGEGAKPAARRLDLGLSHTSPSGSGTALAAARAANAISL